MSQFTHPQCFLLLVQQNSFSHRLQTDICISLITVYSYRGCWKIEDRSRLTRLEENIIDPDRVNRIEQFAIKRCAIMANDRHFIYFMFDNKVGSTIVIYSCSFKLVAFLFQKPSFFCGLPFSVDVIIRQLYRSLMSFMID